jgi:multidrug resistance efflux pump
MMASTNFSSSNNDNTIHNQPDRDEKRIEPRVDFPIVIKINDSRHIASNWSTGGFKVEHFDSNFQVGDCLPVHLSLKLKGGIKVSLDALSEIVWRSREEQAAGFRFLNLRQHEKELLNGVIQDFQKGKLTTEEVEIEETASTSVLKEPSTTEKTQKKSGRWRLIFVVLFVLGFGLLSATSIALYRAIAFMYIDSAAVARSFKEVISTHRGKLSQLYIREGMKVEKGDPLLRVYDEQMAQFVAEDRARNLQQIIRDKRETIERLQQEIELSRARLEEAKGKLGIARSLKQEEIQDMKISQEISQKQLDKSQKRVESLETQRRIAQRRLQRMEFLLQEGAVAEQRVDNVKAKLAEVRGELKQARKEVEIKQDILAAIERGSFYNGERFNGELPELEAETQEAAETMARILNEIAIYENEINKQQREIDQLQQQYQKQQFQLPQPKIGDPSKENLLSKVYKSPLEATVYKIEEPAGQNIQIGQTLLILRPENEHPTVDAFLTQDQASQVSLGTKVEVTIPEFASKFDRTYNAEVTKIDRSGGLRDDVRARYQFEGSTNRPVYVQLAIMDLPESEERFLEAGTPVELKIPKEMWFKK